MKYLISLIFIATLSLNAKSQDLGISVGTDLPYQHFLGVALQTKPIDVYYRTGILIPPYSNIILGIIEQLGTNEIYTRILKSTYEFGWMNSLGVCYKFGKQKKWYGGPEFRLDYLTASKTPSDLIGAVVGKQISIVNNPFIKINTELGLIMYAFGVRFGRSFVFGTSSQYSFNLELSVYKNIETQSILSINNQQTGELNELLDQLLWKDVFKKYGYIGGIGISFKYSFRKE